MSSYDETMSNTPQTILVVDNLEEVRGIIGGWLARQGYRVMEAESGKEAVEQARRLLPDLILMDLKMPGGMDGIDAALAIQADMVLREVPIVAVSADNTEYSKGKALEFLITDLGRKIVEILKRVNAYET